MKVFKIKQFVLCSLAALSVSAVMVGISASAGVYSVDTNDTIGIDITVGPSGNGYYNLPTPNPHKDSTNSVYVYLSQANFAVNCRVLGCSSSTSSGGTNCGSAQVRANTPTYISNSVRNSYDYCNLAFQSTSSYAGVYINGSWVSY